MKTLKDFLSEQPTNSVGADGYQRDATASGPVAGDDKKLFKGSDDLVTQDYQTPAEPGLAKWRFSNVYPLSLGSLSYDIKASDVDYITVQASFNYLNYDIVQISTT